MLRQKSLEYEKSEDLHDATDNLDLLVGEEVRPQASVDSEKFFIPFELACKGDVAKITIIALDGIQVELDLIGSILSNDNYSTTLMLRLCTAQKLVAYGEIVGDFPDPKMPTRRLIDRIVDTICSCHTASECDEGVELQIIKV